MFILSCNGQTVNVYQGNQVAREVELLSSEHNAPVSIIQHCKYIGDGVETNHLIGVIFPQPLTVH